VVAKAAATVTLGGLYQAYDGAARPVTVTTVPAGLATTVTYGGSATVPVVPGNYAVSAVINDTNYTGQATGTEIIYATVLVKTAPTMVGDLLGSLQLTQPLSVTLQGGSIVNRDLLIPGTPSFTVTSGGTLVGVRDWTGTATPTAHRVSVNGGAMLRYLVRRVNAPVLPTVTAPPAPRGTRLVTITASTQSIGDPATLLDLTVRGTGVVAKLPAGTSRPVSVQTGAILEIEQAGATTPSVYNLQGLTIAAGTTLRVVGPVRVVLPGAPTLSGTVGNVLQPSWLRIEQAAGSLTLSGSVVIYGEIFAPAGTVTVGNNCRVLGRIYANGFSLSSLGVVEQP